MDSGCMTSQEVGILSKGHAAGLKGESQVKLIVGAEKVGLCGGSHIDAPPPQGLSDR